MKSLKTSNQTNSSDTREAIAELGSGKGVKFNTTKEFFDDLLNESAVDSQSGLPASIDNVSSSKLHKD